MTELINASYKGDLEQVISLLNNGADVNATDEHEKTSLVYACQRRHLEIVKCLIENGANVNFVCSSGWTCLMIASERGNLEIVKCLIENGANNNIKSVIRSATIAYCLKHFHIGNYLISLDDTIIEKVVQKVPEYVKLNMIANGVKVM